MGNLVVHLNGWPGVGKLTIARALSRRLGGRLMDNHTLLNPAEALFERDDPQWLALRQEIRALVLAYMARIESPATIVLTDALSDHEVDRGWFEDCRRLAATRAARLVAVMIACDAEENVRRMQSPGRAEAHKLTRPEVLIDLRARYALLRPQNAELIDLDVTHLTAEQAAETLARSLLAPAQPSG